MLSEVQKYIYQALNINDNQVRPRAEASLFQIANQSCTQFFVTLAQIISNNSNDIINRQSTCTVFSRLVAFRLSQNLVYWDNVHQSVKQNIKDMLLSTLISNDMVLMKAGANTVAHIASIEIPRGEWLDILDSLAQNTQHEEYTIRMASVVTLGFICQELKNTKSNINIQSCKQILGSLLMSLEKEGEIVDLALAALRDSIQFLKNIFIDKIQFCNKMFQYLMPILNHQDFRQKVYEILFQFCKYCYHLLDAYLGVIVNFTISHIQLRNDDSILALTLWETIGTEYLERRDQRAGRLNQNNQFALPNFVVIAHREILTQVMGCILILKKSDYEFSDLRESAVQTLSVLIQCGNKDMIETVTQGVSKVLTSSHPGQRQASALLFSCLSNFQDREDILTRFRAGFNHLYKLLQDPQIIVVKNTLNGFVTLSQIFPEVFLTNPQIKQIFIHLLGISKQADEVMSLLTLNILNNITEVLQAHPDPIATDPQQIITEVVRMFEAGLEEDTNKESSQKLVILLMNIIMSTNQMNIVNQLIGHLIPKYHYFAKKNIKDKAIVLQHIVTVIHTCLLAFSKTALPKTQFKDQIYHLIDKHIQYHGVETQGISLISAAANCYKKDFRVKLQYYWNNIMHGLSLIHQKPTFKAALACVSDIARNHETEIVDKLNLVFQKLVEFMHQNIDRQLKTDILKCFGDLCLGLKRYSDNFIVRLLEIVQNCFTAVYMFSQSESQKGYAQELKQALIEMYHCMVMAVNSQQRINQKTAAHYKSISQFVVKSCDVKYKPTVEYLKNCLYLIIDSALYYTKHASYANQVMDVLQSNEIAHLIETVKRYRDRLDIQELLLLIQSKVKPRR